MSFNDDDFADFQNYTDEENKDFIINNDENDFADFQNADQNLFINNINENNISTTNEFSKFESFLKDAFSLGSENENKYNVIIKTDFFVDDYKKNLWEQFENLEESPSLKLKWEKTQSFQNFLTALRVDPKNTLSNPNVPIFASTLGLLEPTKINNNKEKRESTLIKANLEEKLIEKVKMTILDPNSINNQNNIDSDIHKKNIIPIESLNLKNNDQDLSNKQNKINEGISSESSKILDELPILSFMRSNVLMFPINP